MDASELNTLTAMVRDGDPGPLSFYPATLLQLAHRGTVHNFSPLAEDIMQDLGNGEKNRRYLFRFYFDGLVIMMHRPRSNEPIPDHGTMTVGASSTLIVLTIPTAGSLEMRNIAKIHKEAIEQWPDTMSRLDPLAWMRKELGDG
jgi:hypothetical protein